MLDLEAKSNERSRTAITMVSCSCRSAAAWFRSLFLTVANFDEPVEHEEHRKPKWAWSGFEITGHPCTITSFARCENATLITPGDERR